MNKVQVVPDEMTNSNENDVIETVIEVNGEPTEHTIADIVVDKTKKIKITFSIYIEPREF